MVVANVASGPDCHLCWLAPLAAASAPRKGWSSCDATRRHQRELGRARWRQEVPTVSRYKVGPERGRLLPHPRAVLRKQRPALCPRPVAPGVTVPMPLLTHQQAFCLIGREYILEFLDDPD